MMTTTPMKQIIEPLSKVDDDGIYPSIDILIWDKASIFKCI
jgi:hypothetical protein